MADNVRPRVKAPRKAEPGEAVTIKTLISHPMESGQRKDADGNTIPRSIIHRFTCEFNGEMVVDV
ncbi:MAG TPA: thiosulfate oxidation carrier complex protein SoxZ, partial [Roseovarius sp.]|nr:thiosulfate oxidation carrier complex protein SoxZ [Roseovarius sp.]